MGSEQSTPQASATRELGLLPPMTDANLPDSAITPSHRPAVIQLSESSEISPDAPPGGQAMMEKEVVEESGAIDEEEEDLRNAIEKDLLNLTLELAEIETTRERLDAADVDEVVKDEGTAEKDEKPDEEEDGEGGEAVEEENDVEWDENSGDVTPNVGIYYHEIGSNPRRVNYPMRTDAEDCAFYMKFGACKFGSNCKFNHPPRRKNQGFKERASHKEENSERAGQTRCKYYMTSEGCKYGSDCRYYHGADKLSTSHTLELNFLGLPIRLGEKECPYYMRTGSCKYGSTCRFHHPEPSAAAGSGSSTGHSKSRSLPSPLVSSSTISSWSSPRPLNETSPILPVMFSPTHNTPTSNQEWNGHQAASYPTLEKTLPTPPAFAVANQLTEIHLPLPHQNNMIVEEYPERPGEPECNFFMKTGDCKFKSNCKFHHPKNRTSRPNANSFALNDKGLPLRPDQPICAHYQRYGICKYGPACKYDHPPQFSIMRTPFVQPPFGKPNLVQGPVEIGKGSDS